MVANEKVSEENLSEEIKDEIINEQEVEEKDSEENLEEVEDVKLEEDSTGENDMNKKLKQKEKEVNEYVDKLQRTMAEFDNFRKRTIKEKSMMYENGAKETLEKLLPIVDNFERALDSISEEQKELPFTQGVEMIFKQLMSALNELGVEEIKAEGNEFDPNFHHAVTHADDESLGENIVAEVFQKGYMYNDSVLRHSMVKVVN
ncbi:nucleotide exchange factor GrpE [Vallitalea guaymasensis]|uniref:Protein GrpE n=1 Tax=Vallitalea guaymasensis TaxID=1185412 RepID=A0A8J8MG84_9FIRM|nr:nucleotide exchange factor GrpE [Vallitalea guaymasensis]QUH32070.1 nucleotide exchange factor GrpE [Vallitalea guaymasensis]